MNDELYAAQQIFGELKKQHISQGMDQLRVLKDEVHAAIPIKKRQSQGITWVVQRISDLLTEVCQDETQAQKTALLLYDHLAKDDILMGVPIFMMGKYGEHHPTEVFDFFEQVATSENWVVREFSQGGFRSLITPNREMIYPWLKKTAQSDHPYLRRFIGETLRPVTVNHWMSKEPDYSLSILKLMFRESHPYPRTSVGNNLSDLSRRNPELIFTLAKELVESGDKNSYWIAYRACRNLVKKDPLRVMDLLGLDEYHYKDRNFYRSGLP